MNTRHHRTRKFDSKQALHIIFKAEGGFFKTVASKNIVDTLLKACALQFKIKIYHRAINYNHFHVALSAPSKSSLQAFLRVFSGSLSKCLREKFKLKPESLFWAARPHSRLVHWGRDFKGLGEYIAINYLESLGRIRKNIKREQIQQIISKGLTRLFPAVVNNEPKQLELALPEL